MGSLQVQRTVPAWPAALHRADPQRRHCKTIALLTVLWSLYFTHRGTASYALSTCCTGTTGISQQQAQEHLAARQQRADELRAKLKERERQMQEAHEQLQADYAAKEAALEGRMAQELQAWRMQHQELQVTAAATAVQAQLQQSLAAKDAVLQAAQQQLAETQALLAAAEAQVVSAQQDQQQVKELATEQVLAAREVAAAAEERAAASATAAAAAHAWEALAAAQQEQQQALAAAEADIRPSTTGCVHCSCCMTSSMRSGWQHCPNRMKHCRTGEGRRRGAGRV